jgi:predicted glycosyltransferase involved in capsule biosynthesis
MIKCSFVIIYHPSRIENLNQTLRFLEKREKELLDQELILVCQTRFEKLKTKFKNNKQINLNIKNYHKSLMTNVGVNESKGDILILLDSDRILPENYFLTALSKIKQNSVLSTKELYRLEKDYSDSDIEQNNINKIPEYRSEFFESRKKNMFSGNTVVFKSDYGDIGGYDESFVGYGFADNDICMKCLKHKVEFLWLEEFEEWHLQHNHEMCWEEKMIHRETFKIILATNAWKYLNKWKLEPDSGFWDLINIAEKDMNRFPKNLINFYNQEKEKFKKIKIF